jgi:hypothetical protein
LRPPVFQKVFKFRADHGLGKPCTSQEPNLVSDWKIAEEYGDEIPNPDQRCAHRGLRPGGRMRFPLLWRPPAPPASRGAVNGLESYFPAPDSRKFDTLRE